MRYLLPLLCAATVAHAQTPIDPALLAYINGIRAIDSHAHPMRPVAPGAPADSEYDALPLGGIPPFAAPWRLSLEAPIWRTAQNALYHIPAGLRDSAYRDSLKAHVARAQRDHGQSFPAWALDQAGIDIMMSNRIVLGAGLAPPRFRWVSFVDALMLPLDGSAEAARTPDTKPLYPL